MMPKSILIPLIIIIEVSAFIISNECQPLIFEQRTNFNFANDELQLFSNLNLYISEQTQSTGIYPNRHNYSVNNIVATATYDPSKTSIIEKDGYIIVSGSLDYLFKYNANKSSGVTGNYNGTASASLKTVNINYLKSLKPIGAEIGFQISSTSYLIGEIVPNNDYAPSISQADKSQFNNLVKQITPIFKTIFNRTLESELNRLMSKYNIKSAYGQNYLNYYYNDNSIVVNTSIKSFEYSQPNIIIGYNGNSGSQTVCGSFHPSFSSHNTIYISHQFIKGLLSQYFTNTSFIIDKKSKTSVFKFIILDLSNIIPEATNTFTNYKDNIYISCTNSGFQVKLTNESKANLNASWHCGTYHEASKTNLINFKITASYVVDVQYVRGHINTRIQQIVSSQIVLSGTLYPITNEDLAKIYIKSIIESFVNEPSVGDQFPVPMVGQGSLWVTAKYLKIESNL